MFPCGTVHGHVPSLQAVSAPEDAPAESAPEKPSDAGEDGVAEDAADAGGRGGSGGKKEAPSSKAVLDGKLVKGAWPVGLGDGLRRGGAPSGGARPGGGELLGAAPWSTSVFWRFRGNASNASSSASHPSDCQARAGGGSVLRSGQSVSSSTRQDPLAPFCYLLRLRKEF